MECVHSEGIPPRSGDKYAIDQRAAQLYAYGRPVFPQGRSKHQDEHQQVAGNEGAPRLNSRQDCGADNRLKNRQGQSKALHAPWWQERLSEHRNQRIGVPRCLNVGKWYGYKISLLV
jgi:hypothetical protein